MKQTAAAQIPSALIVLAVLTMVLVFGALLFLPAGRLDWIAAWVYVAIVCANTIINWVCLRRWNPGLIARRMRFGEGTKTWDIVWACVYAPVMAAVYIVAGLDARDGVFGLPLALWPLGLGVFVAGAAMLTWSMVVNPFFEKTVRIQTELGHYVVDTGPYAYVRHPGYVGFIGWILGTPFLLGSFEAFVPALLAVLGIVVRTLFEDRTLSAELVGYPDYARRVRFRLVPGIW